MTLEERINSFARAGIDEAFVLPFDASIASLDPEAFLDEALVDAHRRAARGRRRQFSVRRQARAATSRSRGRTWPNAGCASIGRARPRSIDGERVSSTRVRAAIAAGDLAAADRLLGTAVHAARARGLRASDAATIWAFPPRTSSCRRQKLLPPDGVYSATGRHDGRDYRGLVSIGTNPTFGGIAAHGRSLAARLFRLAVRRGTRVARSAFRSRAAAFRNDRRVARADARRRRDGSLPVVHLGACRTMHVDRFGAECFVESRRDEGATP